MKTLNLKTAFYVLTVITDALFFMACVNKQSDINVQNAIYQNDTLKEKIEHLKKTIDVESKRMTFNTADFVTLSYHEWIRIPENHIENVKVTWPDGRHTIGLESHIEALKTIFAHAPDTKITEHSMRTGWANQIAVFGIATGTFTEPMKTHTGAIIKPTGKTFSVPIYAISVWENSQMVEKNVFWDTESYMDQLGIQI